jgi:hypothetical protein
MSRLGILSKTYVNTGTYGSPTWEEIDLIGDLAVNPSWNEGESTARRTRLQTFEPTTLALDVTGKVRVDETDTGFGLLEDSFLNNTVLDVMALNGSKDNEGAAGFRYDARVLNWSEDQALGNVLFKDFNLRPCASANVPKAVKVTAGVPVFSDIGETSGS